jgi:hypothetical protein
MKFGLEIMEKKKEKGKSLVLRVETPKSKSRNDSIAKKK